MEGMMERWNDGRWAMGMVWMMMVVLSTIPTFHLSAQDYRAQAIRILRTVPLIDGHNDIPDALRERGGVDSVDFAVRQPRLMTDIPKLRAGHDGGRHRTQLRRRQDVVSDRHRRRPRDRELARRAAHVLQSRHPVHDADPLA